MRGLACYCRSVHDFTLHALFVILLPFVEKRNSRPSVSAICDRSDIEGTMVGKGGKVYFEAVIGGYDNVGLEIS